MSVSENELFERVKASDMIAFEQLYNLYYPRLARFIYRITQDEDDIVAIINDVFMVVWESASSFEAKAQLSSWIMGIAYRKGLNQVRSHRSWLNYDNDSSNDQIAIDNTAATDSAEAAMAILKPDQRAIVELAYYFGYSYEEIATITGSSTSKTRNDLFAARKKLRANKMQIM